MMIETNASTIIVLGADALKSGMILAEDLHHFNGRLILKSGTCLSPRDLRIIKMWGVLEAKIEIPGSGNIEKSEGIEEPVNDEATNEYAREFFRFTDLKHELSRELYRIFIQRFRRKSLRENSRLNLKPLKKSPEKIDIREKITNDVSLPSLPSIVSRINEAISNPNCTATHIADIISKDSSLTARLLKLVNSAFYNFPMPIESISKAVTIIGTRQLSSLALATSVTSTFTNLPPEIIDMKSFWKHSVTCGIVSRLLSSYKENVNTESYFLSGLLHDIGRLIMCQYFPDHMHEILRMRESNPDLLVRLEPEKFTRDHAEVGSILIEQWKLPPVLEQACRYHHMPMQAQDKRAACIVHVADLITNMMHVGTSGAIYSPALAAEAWEFLELPINVVNPIIQQADIIVSETMQSYISDKD